MHRRRNVRAAREHHPDGREQVHAHGLLDHEASHAVRHESVGHRRLVVVAQDHEAQAGVAPADVLARVEELCRDLP